MSPSVSDLERLRLSREGEGPAAREEPRGRWPVLPVVIAGLVLVAAAVVFVFLGNRAPMVEVAPVEVTGAVAGAGGAGTAGGSAITANGYVVARTKASVSAKIAGRLEYLGVAEGSTVRQGEFLAGIESADFKAAFGAARADEAEAHARLAQVKSDLARAQELHARGVISAVELENARTRAASLEAALQALAARAQLAAANLENTNVRAPFNGTVLRKDAEVGEIVAPSSAGGGLTRTAIVTMADLGTLEVEVDVNEAYIARITNGQDARITLDAYPDTSFAGRVRQVVPTADRQKATVQVKVSITDRDPRILPEMGARVDFVPPGQDAAAAAVPRRLFVPEAALVPGGTAASDGARVWIVKDGKAAAVTVTTGRVAENGRVPVSSGLSGDEHVIVNPPADLKEGARVRVKGA